MRPSRLASSALLVLGLWILPVSPARALKWSLHWDEVELAGNKQISPTETKYAFVGKIRMTPVAVLTPIPDLTSADGIDPMEGWLTGSGNWDGAQYEAHEKLQIEGQIQGLISVKFKCQNDPWRHPDTSCVKVDLKVNSTATSTQPDWVDVYDQKKQPLTAGLVKVPLVVKEPMHEVSGAELTPKQIDPSKMPKGLLPKTDVGGSIDASKALRAEAPKLGDTASAPLARSATPGAASGTAAAPAPQGVSLTPAQEQWVMKNLDGRQRNELQSLGRAIAQAGSLTPTLDRRWQAAVGNVSAGRPSVDVDALVHYTLHAGFEAGSQAAIGRGQHKVKPAPQEALREYQAISIIAKAMHDAARKAIQNMKSGKTPEPSYALLENSTKLPMQEPSHDPEVANDLLKAVHNAKPDPVP